MPRRLNPEEPFDRTRTSTQTATDGQNFAWLLVALLIFLISMPLIDAIDERYREVAGAATFSLLTIIGIWSLRGGGWLYWLGFFFVFDVVAFNIIGLVFNNPAHAYATFGAIFGFLLVSILFTLGKVARGTEVSANRLIGAICIYLMLGVAWAVAYTMVGVSDPQAFTGIAPRQEYGWNSGWLYFSFSTMTTLGYGDIVPASSIARTLAYLQAIFGQFYIAILVAGLVSAYITTRGSGHS
jgi:voltage-gated potassium channel